MQYFFLEKQSPLTQRWKLREVAFDSKFRYLYYSAALRLSDLEAVVQDSGDGYSLSLSSSASRRPSVTWKQKIKVTSLDYEADRYCVPPTSASFDEHILLTLTVTGFERALEKPDKRRSGRSSRAEGSFAGSSIGRPASEGPGDDEVPEPEFPSMELHVEDYHVQRTAQQQDELEDEEEDLFRDIELYPDEDENPITGHGDDSEGSETNDEEDEESESDSIVPLSPTTLSLEQLTGKQRQQQFQKQTQKVTITFRAPNYDVYRMFSLRLRQALVRHGVCPPLHCGLPQYDPRNGIALATVPLHLRYAFRRLNDVVFYSLQSGHTVYVRHMREVRGLHGYLCITHDSVLLLQDDGKCPRWLDLEDIVGIDYVLQGSHSFVSLLAREPYPDFVFIPIFPSYPMCASFDAEETVEGIVSMLRRLLMQRLRSGEEVSLPRPPPRLPFTVNTATEVEEYDVLCHIRDLSKEYPDVFKYITYQGAGRPMQWKWDNSKTPTHFTFKRELVRALQKDEDEALSILSSPTGSSDDDGGRHSGRGRSSGAARRTHEAFIPPASNAMLVAGGGSIGGGGGYQRVSGRETRDDMMLMSSSLNSQASFTTTTVAQLLAPPSKDAEMRAKRRLRVTRTDPERRQQRAAAAASSSASPSPTPTPTPLPGTAVTTSPSKGVGHSKLLTPPGGPVVGKAVPPVLKGTASTSGGPRGAPARPPLPTRSSATSTRTVTGTGNSATAAAAAGGMGLPPRPKPASYGLVPGQQKQGPAVVSHVVPASKGKKLPISSPKAGEDGVEDTVVSSTDTTSSGEEEEEDVFDSEDMEDLLETSHNHCNTGDPVGAQQQRRVQLLKKQCPMQGGGSGGGGAHHHLYRRRRAGSVEVSDEEDEESSSENDGVASMPSPTLQANPATIAYMAMKHADPAAKV